MVKVTRLHPTSMHPSHNTSSTSVSTISSIHKSIDHRSDYAISGSPR